MTENNDRIELTIVQQLQSMVLGSSMLEQCIEQYKKGVHLDVLINILSCVLGSLVAEKLKVSCEDPSMITDKIMEFAIQQIKADAESPFPKPSNN